MIYYKLLQEYKTNVIGNIEVPQSKELAGNNILEASKVLQEYWKQEPILSPIETTYLLKSGVKITDYISVMQGHSNYGIVLSNRLVKFIHNYNVPDSWKVPVSLLINSNSNKIIEEYFIFAIKESIISLIDVSSSKFYISSVLEKYFEEVNFTDVEEIKNFESNKKTWHLTINFGRLLLKPGFNYDIFRLGFNLGGYYLSERLKTAIEKEGFTGMRFEAAPEIVVGD